MKLRWKMIGFLSIFLGSSFLLLLWKSNSIFQQKYATYVYQQEATSLEQISNNISNQLLALESALQKNANVSAILKHYHVKLIGQTVKENGRWRARWQEGVSGTRSQVKDIIKQIPLQTLPATRKSWYSIEYQSKEKGYAYVVPQAMGAESGFFIFLLDHEFFQNTFVRLGDKGAFSLFSPFLGELFSTDKNKNLYKTIDAYRENIKANQQGFLKHTNNLNLVYLFNPDLQLYLFKTVSKPTIHMGITGSSILLFLMAIALIFIAILVVDYMLMSIFYRVERVTDGLLRDNLADTEEIAIHGNDEISQLELAYNMTLEDQRQQNTSETSLAKITPSQGPMVSEAVVTPKVDELLEQIRPKAISALGHLHKIKKTEGSTSSVATLEAELRDMRKIMDKAEMGSQKSVFSPKLQLPIEEPKRSMTGLTIRKPKRAEDESRDV